MKKIIRPFYQYACVITMLAACSVPKPVTVKNTQVVPATFNSSADTMSAGNIQWDHFFTDSNLVHLINTALHNNLDMGMALQRVMVAKANILYAKGAMLPTVNLVASGGVERYGDYTMNGVGNYDTDLSPNISKDQHIPSPTTDVFLGLRSQWEIDVWGKLKNKKKAAYADYMASSSGRLWVTTQVVAEVANLYYELLAQDNNMRIIKRNIELQQKAFEIVQTQKEGGRATELAVQQFKAQLLHTKSFEFEINQSINRIENEINMLLGRFPQAVVRDTSILAQSLPQTLTAGVPAGLLTRRADVQQAEWQLRATQANTEAARKAFLPSVTITPYAGVNAFNFSLLFKPGSLVFGVLGGLSQPLFNQQQLKADFGVANAQQTSALYAYQKNVLQAFGEVATTLQAIDNYKQYYKLKEDEAKALGNAVVNANDLYLTGAASYLEVITAQKGVLDAQLEEISGKKALLLATVDLYRSLGGGWN